MSKFTVADDGKTIDGRILVYLRGVPPQPGSGAEGGDSTGAASGAPAASGPREGGSPTPPAPKASPGQPRAVGVSPLPRGPEPLRLLPAPKRTPQLVAALGKAQAAALVAAAEKGVPFCEECDRARRALKAQRV